MQHNPTDDIRPRLPLMIIMTSRTSPFQSNISRSGEVLILSDPLIIAEVFAGLACHHVPVGMKSGRTADFSKMLARICRLPRF